MNVQKSNLEFSVQFRAESVEHGQIERTKVGVEAL